MNNRSMRDDWLLRIIGIFLPAGISALLLSIAHFQPLLWFISLFALVPYLWKLKRIDLQGSIILGTTFAICFSLVVFIDELLLSPAVFGFKVLVLIIIFSVFGIAVSRTSKHICCYPIFIAALWIPLEYFLIHYTGIEEIFNSKSIGPNWLIRMGSLFGLLTISFFIMLINSVILLLFEYAGSIRFSKTFFSIPDRTTLLSLFVNIRSTKRWYCLPNLRAPPRFFPSV